MSFVSASNITPQTLNSNRYQFFVHIWIATEFQRIPIPTGGFKPTPSVAPRSAFANLSQRRDR